MYNKNLKGLIPFFVTYGVIYIALFVLLLFALESLLRALLFSAVLLGSRIMWLIFSSRSFVRTSLNINYFEVTNEGLLSVARNDNKSFLVWKDIVKMQFVAGSWGGIVDFIGGKNFGYYQLIDGNNNIVKIPPTVNNRDQLIEEIIQKAGLIKFAPNMQSSILGSFLAPQRHKGDFNWWIRGGGEALDSIPDVSPRQFSSLLDYVVAAIAAIGIMVVALYVYYYIEFGRWYGL